MTQPTTASPDVHLTDDLVVNRDTLVHQLLDGAVAAVPDGPAVSDAVENWTYRQLDRFSDAFAGWLLAQGVRPGDRVVVQLGTSARLTAVFFGTCRVGAIFVPLHPEVREYQLRSLIADAEPAVLVVEDAAAPMVRTLTSAAVHGMGRVWSEVEALAERVDQGLPHVEVKPDDIAVLIYTSGSTATPKAVVCPHNTVTFAASAIQAVLGYRPDDVVFSRFPMSWDYGLYKVLLSCLGRSHLILADGTADLLMLRRLRETGATVVPVVPSLATMIVALAARDSESAPRVRMFTCSGAVLPESTVDALRRAFPNARVVRQFGLTECKRLTIMPPDLERERPGSAGLALPGTEVLILDEDGRPVPAGQTGEMVAVGPHVMAGYWRAPDKTARTFRTDSQGRRRLHTGDYGHVDEDGFLYFDGRRDDMFKRRGIRMSTVEIEAAANDIPGVRAAVVLAPTDQHDLAIFVECELEPRQVLRELALRLEPAKVPSICRLISEIPLTINGKSKRAALEALLTGGSR